MLQDGSGAELQVLRHICPCLCARLQDDERNRLRIKSMQRLRPVQRMQRPRHIREAQYGGQE